MASSNSSQAQNKPRQAVQFPVDDDSDQCPSADEESTPSSVVTGAAVVMANGTDADKSNKKGTANAVKECSGDVSSDSGDDDDDDEQETGGGDAWKIEDGMGISCECIICPFKTSGYEAAELMKDHIEDTHKLSFHTLKTSLKLNYPGFIQFVRFARKVKDRGLDIVQLVSEMETSKASPANYPWSSDEYLLPSDSDLQSDYFLTLDYFEVPEATTDVEDYQTLKQEKETLQETIKQMEDVFRRVVLDKNSDAPSPKSKTTKKTKKTSKLDGKSDNDLYFMSYDELTIHHEMVFDHPRTNAYRKAIIEQTNRIKDSYVMDLGCGSGILSMFCAQQGAKKVYAIDNAEIIYEAMSNSYENGFDSQIEFFRKDIDKEDLDIEKVDVIVSEFMGYFLFFEGMTETFIRTRDKYLKPGGVLMPDACNVYLVPVGRNGIYSSRMDCWDNVYGLKMSAMKELTMKEIPINSVSPDEVIGPAVCVKNLNLYTCAADDTKIDAEFVFRMDKETDFCAIAGYFDATFSGENKNIVLSTGPADPQTHWKQAVFFLPKPRRCSKGEELPCKFKSYPHHENPRWLMVEITLDNITHKFEFN
ncbi:unnamed protein product [Orchesella dallaii]|uniref:Protein arginine N-methyltransferase domain-containing protein n=1 Tax=Orchesella dallaii TaxID=48710 RepID=A0ABP1RA91_9HEXA